MNILSIDFDIIMEPCIEMYNDIPGDWNERLEHHSLLYHCQPDYILYQQLTQYIVEIFKVLPKDKIHFIYSHEEILKYFPINQEFNLIHIDHHHDFGYMDKDIPILEKNELRCGNWLKYMFEQEYYNCNFVQWINGYNSRLPRKELNLPKNISLKDFKQVNFSIMEKPDEVIVCFSEAWIPPYIQLLFYLWMDLANIHYNTHFNFE